MEWIEASRLWEWEWERERESWRQFRQWVLGRVSCRWKTEVVGAQWLPPVQVWRRRRR
jgi:hypothetical protein